MSTIGALLAQRERLAEISDSAALDVELLLCHCLDCARSHLRARPEREVPEAVERCFEKLLQRRIAGEPVAHLTGRREFWSLPLEVDASTLIPRPDTERLVEIALELMPATALDVLDLGSGTGAIALALASERPQWRLLGVDRSPAAVALAQRNAARLGIGNAQFAQSDWFAALQGRSFDLMVGNPPYIDAHDPHLQQGDVRFEPRSALVAGNGGLDALAAIAAAAPGHLRRGGRLLCEHGWEQGAAVRGLLAQHGFTDVATWLDWGDRERVSGGVWP